MTCRRPALQVVARKDVADQNAAASLAQQRARVREWLSSGAKDPRFSALTSQNCCRAIRSRYI